MKLCRLGAALSPHYQFTFPDRVEKEPGSAVGPRAAGTVGQGTYPCEGASFWRKYRQKLRSRPPELIRMASMSGPPNIIENEQASAVNRRSIIFGEGEMADLIRGFDWSATPVGPIEQWPNALRITVNTMLGTRQPMFLWWG